MDRDTLAERIVRAPFHRWLGLEVEKADATGVELVMPWRGEIVSRADPPIMHGGVVAALIDTAGLYAVLAAGGSAIGTAYMHVDYHRPVVSGTVRVRARALKLGRRISVAEAMVYGEGPEPLASGRGGYFPP
ncbi:PaaI family thioesterase [Paeniroseomonas aquatica]|uniref:PaaI family thioesterase n=1 Tax=Paeniroseomonas aquatica TaxID=373043 RepID=A0ABT8A1X5_9PROT|nr:PaaI family thioesterase [Paeniroseomonas aquatica]MDN3563626.1 PaaI family thioesterase [Paeniroseomonas aquatica]